MAVPWDRLKPSVPAVDWGRVAAGLFAGGALALLAGLLAVELAEPATTAEPATPAGSATSALFGGAPATGPWQRIGSVAEVTAAGAGAAAADDLAASWRAHGLPDALWDELVAQVSGDLVAAGAAPVADDGAGRPAATGGVQWTDSDTGGRGIVASFDAVASDGEGQERRLRWAYVVDPEHHTVVAGPRRLRALHGPGAVARLDARTWRWAQSRSP